MCEAPDGGALGQVVEVDEGDARASAGIRDHRADEHRERERVHDEQRHHQRRAPQDAEVLGEQGPDRAHHQLASAAARASRNAHERALERPRARALDASALARTPAGLRAKTRRPSCSTTRRSACSVRLLDVLGREHDGAAAARHGAQESPTAGARWRGSRLAVGSSRNTTAGSATRPIATFRRWTLPTESSCARAVRRVDEVDRLEQPLGLGVRGSRAARAGEQAQVLPRASACGTAPGRCGTQPVRS